MTEDIEATKARRLDEARKRAEAKMEEKPRACTEPILARGEPDFVLTRDRSGAHNHDLDYVAAGCDACWTEDENIQPDAAPGLLQGSSADRPLGTGAANPGEPSPLEEASRTRSVDAPNLQDEIRACGAVPSEVRPAWLIRDLRKQLAKVTEERDRWIARNAELERRLDNIRAATNNSDAVDWVTPCISIAEAIDRAVIKWGTRNRWEKLREECAELAEAFDDDDGSRGQALVDEVADVLITVLGVVRVLKVENPYAINMAIATKLAKFNASIDGKAGK